MRHVRHDRDFFEFSSEPFPAFRPSTGTYEDGRKAALRAVYGVRPAENGLLPEGAFRVLRPQYALPAITPPEAPEEVLPGILLFGHVVGASETTPDLMEGRTVTLIDLPTNGSSPAGRAFSAVLRGDDRVVMRTVNSGGGREAHVFKSDGSYRVFPWEDYHEEWKLRRLARLCFD